MMAKTYLDIVKYMVEAKFSINGMVDKPDIIGAVFGQTEGLLGNELDLRELQKGGKIGRIEIELSQSGNRCYGKLFLPASLDRIETCILAAAVESVDRVGPYEAQFTVDKVEDTRSEKRRKILTRAKDLVKLLLNTEIPDSKELSELVQSEVRTSEITTYGPEKLPAGPEVGRMPDVIIVEGRADVLNLLKNDVANVIALGGATAVPKSIIDLCREKEVTVFLDGDRGGDLIFRSLAKVADIDYVARAPDGKEVEDLTRKEVIKAMRAKVPLDQYQNGMRFRGHEQPQQRQYFKPEENRKQEEPKPVQPPKEITMPKEDEVESQFTYDSPSQHPRKDEEESYNALKDIKKINSEVEDEPAIPKIENEMFRPVGEAFKKESALEKQPQPALKSMVLTELASGLDGLSGTLRSRLYDQTGTVIKEVPIRELLSSIQTTGNVYAVVLDGVITQRLVELALQREIKAIYGLRASPIPRRHADIILYTKEQGTIE